MSTVLLAIQTIMRQCCFAQSKGLDQSKQPKYTKSNTFKAIPLEWQLRLHFEMAPFLSFFFFFYKSKIKGNFYLVIKCDGSQLRLIPVLGANRLYINIEITLKIRCTKKWNLQDYPPQNILQSQKNKGLLILNMNMPCTKPFLLQAFSSQILMCLWITWEFC